MRYHSQKGSLYPFSMASFSPRLRFKDSKVDIDRHAHTPALKPHTNSAIGYQPFMYQKLTVINMINQHKRLLREQN